MVAQFIVKPKLEKLIILGCPEGCRKKFRDTRDLNIHLGIVHKVRYKVDLKESYAYRLTTS